MLLKKNKMLSKIHQEATFKHKWKPIAFIKISNPGTSKAPIQQNELSEPISRQIRAHTHTHTHPALDRADFQPLRKQFCQAQASTNPAQITQKLLRCTCSSSLLRTMLPCFLTLPLLKRQFLTHDLCFPLEGLKRPKNCKKRRFSDSTARFRSNKPW